MSVIAHAQVEAQLAPRPSASQGQTRPYASREPNSQDWELNILVTQAAAGSQVAWSQLWERIEPRLHALVRKPRFFGGLAGCECSRRNVVLEVMSRLAADDCRRLHLYLEMRAGCADMQFLPWLFVVAKRVAIDYRRVHDRYVSRRGYRRPGRSAGEWTVMVELQAERLPIEEPPMSDWMSALQLARYADRTLSADQRDALGLWIQSVSHQTIAEQLGLDDAKHSERLVRAALQRLRRHFRSSD